MGVNSPLLGGTSGDFSSIGRRRSTSSVLGIFANYRVLTSAVLVSLCLLAVVLLGTSVAVDAVDTIHMYRASLGRFLADHGFDDEEDNLPADPYAAPGVLMFDESKPLETDWRPLDPTMDKPVDWIQVLKDVISGQAGQSPLLALPDKSRHRHKHGHRLHGHGPHRLASQHEHQHQHQQKQQGIAVDQLGNAPDGTEYEPQEHESPADLVAPLANRTILIIGDSVDRGGLVNMGENLGLPIKIAQWEDAFDYDVEKPREHGLDSHYLPYQLQLPAPIDTLVTNCFMYGLDNKRVLLPADSKSAEARIPLAEDRIDQLCKPYTDQLKHPVSLIFFQSGLWDLAYFGRLAVANGLSTETPLTTEELDWWSARIESVYRKIEETWPGVPVVTRTMQRASAEGAEARYWHKNPNAEKAAFQNFFTDVRVTQIRNMQEQFAHSHGLELLDFGSLFEGYQKYSWDIHPKNAPGGIIMNKSFWHYMHRAAIKSGFARPRQ